MVRFRTRQTKEGGFISYLHQAQGSLERWRRFFGFYWRNIPFVEKLGLGILLLVVLGSGVWVVRSSSTTAGEAVPGGTYVEGVVGFPRYPHPLLAWGNPVDSDLVRLIFSGLVKQGAGREFLPDLASAWQVEDGGKSYSFYLRENLFWHDGAPLTASDVLFTVGLIQSEEFKGVGAKEWRNIKVEAANDRQVRFLLPNPNAFFLRQVTLGILPQHLLQGVTVSDLAAHDFNARPIGSGPYLVEGRLTREQASLSRFEKFYDQKPYIERIIFRFVSNEKALSSLYRSRLINGAGFRSVEVMKELENLVGATVIQRPLPQYQAVFFNPASNSLLKEKAIRQALAYSLDRERIIQVISSGQAQAINSPLPPGFIGHNPDLAGYEFSLEKAARTLLGLGFSDIDKDGWLEKDNRRLSLVLTYRETAEAQKTAELIKGNWQSIGVEVLLKSVPAERFVSEVVRPRDYQVLLFGQDLGSDPDPYLYWHSSQTRDPGLNLSLFYDKDIDNNLELARTETREDRIIRHYHAFQQAWRELLPAILLYQPTYLYLLDAKIKGVKTDPHLSSPSDRFATINEWYIKAKKL